MNLIDYNNKVEVVLDKLSKIDRASDPLVSNLLLFKDYIKRLALIRADLNLHGHIKSKGAQNVLPNYFKGYTHFMEINKTELVEIEARARCFDDLYIHCYVYWEVSKAVDSPRMTDESNPYEPAMLLLLRGGSVFIHNGMFHVTEEEIFFLPSLDKSFLDFVDQKSRLSKIYA